MYWTGFSLLFRTVKLNKNKGGEFTVYWFSWNLHELWVTGVTVVIQIGIILVRQLWLMNWGGNKVDGLDVNDVSTWDLSRMAEANRYNFNRIIDIEA
jgi:hypothetical protein